MAESSYNAASVSLCRTRSIRSATKLAAAVVLGLGAAVGSVASAFESSPENENETNHHYLRNQNPNIFGRSLEESEPICVLDCCMQFEETICVSSNDWINAIPFVIQIILIIVLIALSALFSGLTLGLMSLDKTGLEIVMGGDDPIAASYAKTIYPIRKDGNLLLCTLLLGNVAVNALLSILLSEYAGGVVGFLASTFLIVIFGEILPQAFCSRYALRIGSFTVPVVKVIRFAFFPLAKPLAYCLDLALGRELATTYSNAELMKMLQIHVQENVIDSETAGAMTGALTYKNIAVKDVMTPIERTFMLCVDDKLSFETIAKVFKTGYSRIPVFEVSRDNVIGLLFVKDLIFIDPEDDVPLRSFVQILGRSVHVVWPDDTLGDVLTELKKGKSHLALVRDVNNTDETQDPFYEIRGIITLEDIIEKIIGDTIVDETDAFMDNEQLIKVQRDENFEWARLRLLDSKIVDDMLTPSEVQAVTAHLRMNYSDTVKLLTDAQLNRMVTNTPVTQLETATQQLGKLPDELLYQKGVPSDECTLLLSGKVTILVGSEDFRSDMSAWSVLGKSSFENPNFIPDFSAFVADGPCRCLRFNRVDFDEAVDASAIERHQAQGKLSQKPPSPMPEEKEGQKSNNLSDVPSDTSNRREQLIALLFNEETNSSSAPEPQAPAPQKETSFRQEEDSVAQTQAESSNSSADAAQPSTIIDEGTSVDISKAEHKEILESKPVPEGST